jgi:nucleoid DNA-binding protein
MSAVKDDLIVAVQAQLTAAGVTANKKEAEVYTDAVIAGLLAVTQEKESVRTKLGTFRWAHVEARDRINPRTGDTVSVPAYSTLKFKVGKSVRVLDSEKAPAKKAAGKTAAKPTAKPVAKPVAKPAAKAAAKPAAKPVAKKPVAKK